MILNFRGLLDDKIRIEAFQKAIETLVNPETKIAEIGSALGTYSFFAAKAGAKSVYAIEMDDIYYVGKEIAQQNNLEEKIQFYHDKSTNLSLPEKVDYIIMEDYGPAFLYDGLEKTIVDARKRFLKKNGQFIPNNIILKIAPVSAPTLYKEINLWADKKDILFGIDWKHTTELVINRPHYAETHKFIPLTEETVIKDIDLAKDSGFPCAINTELKIQNTGIIHGLAVWWDCWFTPNQFFSNSPTNPNNTWGQMFFPFMEPIKVVENEQINISLHIIESKSSGQINYKWDIKHKNEYQEQNTFRGNFLSMEKLQSMKISTSSRLNKKGVIVQHVLNNIDLTNSSENNSNELWKKFPDYFHNLESAKTFISDIMENYIH